MPDPTPPRDRRHTTTDGTPHRGQAARHRQVTPVVFTAPVDTPAPSTPEEWERDGWKPLGQTAETDQFISPPPQATTD